MDVLFKPDQQVLEEFAERFRIARVNRRLSHMDLMEKTGIGRGTISRFENGGNISLINLIALLRAIGKLEEFAMLMSQTVPDPRLNYEEKPKRVRK